jgi:uncharacterized membrane protein YbaN (DUF454 family)
MRDRLSRTVVPEAFEDIADEAPLREPSVVHSSHGRLRVHLPHWSGSHDEHIVAGVCRLPGVTGAEANPLTYNLLIRFEPHETSVAALLEALPALRLEQPVGFSMLCDNRDQPPALIAVPEQLSEGGESASIVYMTGTGRVVYKGLGWSSVGMAVVGAIMPGIPTAPFVILAGYFFIRSSPEAHHWLQQTRWFGPILRDWERHRGVRRSIRNAALALIGGGMVLTTLLPLPVPLKVTIVVFEVVGAAIVMRLRVVEPVALAPAGPTIHNP